MPNFETVAQVVTQAAGEMSLNLSAADQANPYASRDANVQQLLKLLSAAGREIVREHSWTQSQNTKTFTTSAGVEAYDLPADFLRMLNQTGWDRTSRFPLGGPTSPQEWQYLAARQSAVTVRVLFRPLQRKLRLAATVPDGHVIAYEYMSSYWVQAAGDPVYSYTSGGALILTVAAPDGLRVGDVLQDNVSSLFATVLSIEGTSVTVDSTTGFAAPGTFTNTTSTAGTKDAPTVASDVLLFDTHLMSRALKRAFLRQKGFNTQAAQEDYDKALAAVMRDDSPAPVLSLTGSRRGELAIGEQSIPVTGFGG